MSALSFDSLKFARRLKETGAYQPESNFSRPVSGWCLHPSRQPPPRFQRVKAPDKSELEDLVQLISQRVGRCLERQGLLEQDTDSDWLELEPADDNDAIPHLLGSSVYYRIAVGPQQGRKAFMIRTIRPLERPDPGLERVAKANGFSLHAGVSCEGHQKDKDAGLGASFFKVRGPPSNGCYSFHSGQQRFDACPVAQQRLLLSSLPGIAIVGTLPVMSDEPERTGQPADDSRQPAPIE
jgi:hypothetical protein